MTALVYRKEIDDYCQRVIEAIHPECVILYGSMARGNAHDQSDIDIIVIGGDLPENFFQRLYALNRLRSGKAPIEAVGYSREEWEKMIGGCHLTALEALEWGEPLYGEALFREWRSWLDDLKRRGLKRGEESWTLPPDLLSQKAA